MKNAFSKTAAKLLALVIVFSLMACTLPCAFAADTSSINTDELIAFAQEHPLLAKLAAKLVIKAAGNAVEGAGEGVGDYYEDFGENTGDQYDDWADKIEDGDLSGIGDIADITSGVVSGATDSDAIGQAAADGATDSFPLNLLGKVKPEITESINAKLADAFSSALDKVFSSFGA
jgi:hypothetical protein